MVFITILVFFNKSTMKALKAFFRTCVNKQIPFLITKNYIKIFFVLTVFFAIGCTPKTVKMKNITIKDGVYLYNQKPFTGKIIDKFPDGVIKLEGDVEDGLAVGEWISWFKTGDTFEKTNYLKGKRDGLLTGWCDCGFKAYEIYYKNDSMNGPSTKFVNGKKISEENYKAGKLNGRVVHWYENGAVELEGFYLSDQQHGKWSYFDNKGNLTRRQFYVFGQMIDEKKFKVAKKRKK